MQYRNLPIAFKNDKQGCLYVPATLSREDYDLLKQQVDFYMEIIHSLLCNTERQSVEVDAETAPNGEPSPIEGERLEQGNGASAEEQE